MLQNYKDKFCIISGENGPIVFLISGEKQSEQEVYIKIEEDVEIESNNSFIFLRSLNNNQ